MSTRSRRTALLVLIGSPAADPHDARGFRAPPGGFDSGPAFASSRDQDVAFRQERHEPKQLRRAVFGCAV
jgi:hypothetical protein